MRPKILSFRWRILLVYLLLSAVSLAACLLLAKAGLDIVISAVVAFLVFGAVAYLLYGRLAKPLPLLVDFTKKLLEGDFGFEIEYFSDDERGDLAALYNELRGRLSENFSEIMTEKQKLETILKQLADGILAVDEGGRFIAANDAARQMLHMSEGDVRNKRYDDIILRFTDDYTLEKIRGKFKRGVHDGRFSYGGRTLDLRFDIFKGSSGNEYGLVVILRDVTERLRMDNMQADFVANVSHELKTPLTSIKGYSETLLSGDVDTATALEFLSIINSETDRMTRLVKDILQMSRLDAGQQKYEFEELEIAALVRTACRKMMHLAGAKNQKLSFDASGAGAARVLVDRDKLDQVIINVVSNAIKYTGADGDIRVRVSASTSDVLISVRDDGIGIPEKDLSRVFERFFMVNKARSGREVGTGLGLSICKQIVEEHRGKISIESELGQGTSVFISLPIVTRS